VPSAPAGRWGHLNLGALGLAGIMLLACVALANRSVDKLTTHQKIQGKVVRLLVSRKGATFPEVAYQFGGKTYQVRSSSSTNSLKIGDPIEVLVPPAQPDQATINHFADMWLGPILTGILGAGCLVVGLFGRRRASGRSRLVHA
jgi:hypothetical protein